jgi:hypothetical protein
MTSDPEGETAQPSVSRTIPPGESKGLDPSVFKGLLRDAMRTYLQILSRSKPRTFPREVFRPHEVGGHRRVNIKFYSYNWSDFSYIVEKEQETSGLKALLDYVWDRGEARITSTGRGIEPQRKNWELNVLSVMVHGSVARALDDAALDEAIDTGAVTPWKVPDEALEARLEEQILLWCRGEHRYMAKCLLGFFEMGTESEWQLAHGIRLRHYTPREIAVLMTRNSSILHWRDQFPYIY